MSDEEHIESSDMKGIAVLHVATERRWRGGEQQAYLLMTGLARRGMRQLLLAPTESALADRCRSEGVCDVARLPRRGRYQPANWLALRRAAREFAPDLIHAHTAHAHALAWLAGPRSVPVVATRRVDFPLRHGFSLGRRYTSPRVYSVAISQAIERMLLKFGCPRERVFLVPSGIDSERFAEIATEEGRASARAIVREELDIRDGDILVGNVAALTDHKGQKYLIDALSKLRQERENSQNPKDIKIVCVIAGRGELEGDLQARIEREELNDPEGAFSARLLGFRDDVPRLLAALDIFVKPSILEGLGTSAIDATCVGLPIISTTAGGLGEIFSDQETALLVPPRDADSLASAIRRVSGDAEFRARLAGAARRSFLEGPYTAKAMVDGNLDVYRRILNSATE